MTGAHCHDAVIVGGGLIGLACALDLARKGFDVALLDRKPKLAETLSEAAGFDNRIYTITPGNKIWLDSLGVWQRLTQERISVIDGMEIWGDADAELNRPPTLRFDAYGAASPHLAYVMEDRSLQTALLDAVFQAGIKIFPASECISLEMESGRASISLANGHTFEAKLIIGCDGADSVIRSLAGIGTRQHPYGQSAIVANFETELQHHNIARQWFFGDSVMAWLPLPGNCISIVWSTNHAERLLMLEQSSFAEEVRNHGSGILGELRQISPTATFPLEMRLANELVRPRVALLGDAAHKIHPLAGQGVNLGFRDVIALSEVLSQCGSREDIGGFQVLRRYERARKSDIVSMQLVTHGLNILFESSQPVIKNIRNLGMALMNDRDAIKKQLINRAIG